ncbi:uncharacterized protein LOC129892971 [Solanum dulcamara]|uniref:uncharacterized protein LOC129892971 n=1 Tax=Solanum dulcamara TaxID=45834 RepID=UPI002485FE5F|nr:uncharacterized protein LOC129892971 [Solanum dulcamara]
MVALTDECISRIQNKLPTKLKYIMSFIMQITINKYINARRLYDLGVSINLMPISIFQKLGLRKIKPTTIILQLADRTVARPNGIIENVLDQVGTLIFPVHFVIFDFEPDQEVLFILGRLLLATGGPLIDVVVGRLTMRAYEMVEVFDVYKEMKLSTVYEEISGIIVTEEDIAAQYVTIKDL